ncbi:hypothetical protein [Cellulomonas sp. Leaf334]|uniref:hypothetical protein n=1 Tax=Cellulomonas sp. Leaf334 TaxID=1736339 RepID=UPI0006FF3C56|nr:hypothetical protein [Cellulomonas sp. Leaf334]KQR17629.1 hypothetical protein ASF78_10285 [Cellulomonas sp. Leaf334]
MTSTRTLLRDANPVPEDRSARLSPRGRAELRALVPSTARTVPLAPRRTRTVRWVAGIAGAVAAAVVAVVVVAPLLPEPQSGGSADYPYYATTAELEGEADLIVRGTFTSTARDDSEGFGRTIASVDVTASAKGPVQPGTTLEIAYSSGGAEGRDDLVPGGTYVILLDDLADLEGDWPPTPVNVDQGFYTVVDGHAVAHPDNPVPLGPETLAALGLS